MHNNEHTFTSVVFATAIFANGAIAGSALQAQSPDGQSGQNPPNIIFFLADDLGVECVGAYGGEAYRTPILDRLAAEGMRFNHCYAGPSCTPSRVALMTGKYNHRNYHNFSMLPRGERTFARITRDAGYRTCIVSKWQLGSGWEGIRGSTPESAGFDESCMKAGNTYWGAQIEINGTKQAINEPYYGPDICCDYAVDFIRRNSDRPFFLYYAFNLPHWDFDATPDSDDLNSRKDNKNFPAMVSYTDKLVGRVVKALDDLGLRDNTLILFSGDNGTASSITSPFRGTMRRGGKGSRRMIDANVPLIANWPGRIKPGGVCDDLVDFSDICPTIAEACGRGDKEAGLDGLSFLPLALGQATTPREWVLSYFKGRDRGNNKNPGFFWIGDHDWKLDHTGKLFHIAKDPMETKPILPKEDTSRSATVRKNFNSVLDRLDVDCRNLWVYVNTKGKPRTRGNLKVRLHGKAKWGSGQFRDDQ